MREILGVTQESPRTQRRWFHDDYFDLFVSQADDGKLHGFQLCYGLDATERALVWDGERGYFHDGTDLLAADEIAGRFKDVARELPGDVARAVARRLLADQGDGRVVIQSLTLSLELVVAAACCGDGVMRVEREQDHARVAFLLQFCHDFPGERMPVAHAYMNIEALAELERERSGLRIREIEDW